MAKDYVDFVELPRSNHQHFKDFSKKGCTRRSRPLNYHWPREEDIPAELDGQLVLINTTDLLQ